MGHEADIGARYNQRGNLTAAQLPEVMWTSDNRSTVDALYRWTEAAAISTLDWYLTEKKSKARWSRSLRALSVLFLTAGGLAPLIAVGTSNEIYAFWGYPILGIGAACIGLDRAFGFSSSWMRYLSATAALHKMLVEYQLKWADLSSAWNNGTPDTDQARLAIAEIRNFAAQLSDLVTDETESWVTEFRGHVSNLEAQVPNP